MGTLFLFDTEALADRSLTACAGAVERLNQDVTKEIHARRVIEEQLRTAQSDI